MLIRSSKFFVLVFLAFTYTKLSATHLRAGEITLERMNCSSRVYRITVTVYIDTEEGVRFGGLMDYLDFGDGSDPDGDGKPGILVPDTPTTPRPDLGHNMGIASFSTIHAFIGPGKFTVSYIEPNRNRNVLNIDNSVETTFYIESQIDVTISNCNNSVKLLVPPH
jgi:hypothetical protein